MVVTLAVSRRISCGLPSCDWAKTARLYVAFAAYCLSTHWLTFAAATPVLRRYATGYVACDNTASHTSATARFRNPTCYLTLPFAPMDAREPLSTRYQTVPRWRVDATGPRSTLCFVTCRVARIDSMRKRAWTATLLRYQRTAC